MKPEYNPAVDDNSALKMLTPLWDVVIRYLTTGLMAIALSTITLQAAKDNLVCIPAVSCKGVKAVCNCSVGLQPSCSLAMDKLCNDSAKDVMTTMGDRRHYDYIDTVCFHEKLGVYSHYFPFFSCYHGSSSTVGQQYLGAVSKNRVSSESVCQTDIGLLQCCED